MSSEKKALLEEMVDALFQRTRSIGDDSEKRKEITKDCRRIWLQKVGKRFSSNEFEKLFQTARTRAAEAVANPQAYLESSSFHKQQPVRKINLEQELRDVHDDIARTTIKSMVQDFDAIIRRLDNLTEETVKRVTKQTRKDMKQKHSLLAKDTTKFNALWKRAKTIVEASFGLKRKASEKEAPRINKKQRTGSNMAHAGELVDSDAEDADGGSAADSTSTGRIQRRPSGSRRRLQQQQQLLDSSEDSSVSDLDLAPIPRRRGSNSVPPPQKKQGGGEDDGFGRIPRRRGSSHSNSSNGSRSNGSRRRPSIEPTEKQRDISESKTSESGQVLESLYVKMVNEISQEMMEKRHMPLQALLRRKRDFWYEKVTKERMLVEDRGMSVRDQFNSLMRRVKKRAESEWEELAKSGPKMDWSFMEMGENFDLDKFNEWLGGSSAPKEFFEVADISSRSLDI